MITHRFFFLESLINKDHYCHHFFTNNDSIILLRKDHLLVTALTSFKVFRTVFAKLAFTIDLYANMLIPISWDILCSKQYKESQEYLDEFSLTRQPICLRSYSVWSGR